MKKHKCKSYVLKKSQNQNIILLWKCILVLGNHNNFFSFFLHYDDTFLLRKNVATFILFLKLVKDEHFLVDHAVVLCKTLII